MTQHGNVSRNTTFLATVLLRLIQVQTYTSDYLTAFRVRFSRSMPAVRPIVLTQLDFLTLRLTGEEH